MLAELLAIAKDGAAKLSTIARAVDEHRRRHGLAELLLHPAADPALPAELAAEYCGGIHVKTLLSDAQAGKIPSVQRSEGGRVRFRLSDLNAYLDNQRRAATRAGSTTTQEPNWSL